MLTSWENFQGLSQSLGTETVLTGDIARAGRDYVLNAERVEAASGNKISEKSWRVPVSGMPAAIVEFSAWVYTELGVELAPVERAFLEDPDPLTANAIEAFVSNIENLHTLELLPRRDLINELREQFPKFPLFARYALHAIPYPRTADDL